jgi:hypothetical protein
MSTMKARKTIFLALTILVVSAVWLAACDQESQPVSSPIPTAATKEPGHTPAATPSATATATPTPQPTSTPTNTPLPTPSPTLTPLHPVILLDNPFNADTLGWEPQKGLDGIAEDMLWLTGPAATAQKWTGYLVSPQTGVYVPGDATFEIELTFEHGPHFSGPYFWVSEGYFAVMLGEDHGLGLLRPYYNQKQYDGLGTVPVSADRSIALKLVFIGDELTVWANGRRIASRHDPIFHEPKSFGGFYVGEEDHFGVSHLTVWTTSEVAAIALTPTPTPANVIVIVRKTDTYRCNPAECGAEPGGYVLGGVKASLLEVRDGWAHVQLLGTRGPGAKVWISVDSYRPYTEADRCFGVPERTGERSQNHFGSLGGVAFWPPDPTGNWGNVKDHWSFVGQIAEIQGTEGDWILIVSAGSETSNKKVFVRDWIPMWLQEANAPAGMPLAESLKPILNVPLDCVFQAGDSVIVWFEGPTAANSTAEVTELVKSTAEFTAVGLRGTR